MLLNRRAIAATTLALLSLPLACASLLDIHAVPVARGDAATPPEEDAQVDAGCKAIGTYCETQCDPVPDFCDDFENPKLGEKWINFLGVENPIIAGEVGTRAVLALDDAGTVPTQSLLAEAISATDNSASAVLATGLSPGRPVRGVRVHFSVRPLKLDFTNDGGTSRKTMSFLAIGSQVHNQGVGVILTEDRDPQRRELDVILQQRAIGNIGDTPKFDLLTLVPGTQRTQLLNNKAQVDVTIGTTELLKERNLPCSLPDAGADGGPSGNMRFYVEFGQLVRKCTAFRDVLEDPSWLNKVALAAGSSVSDFGSSSVMVDDVALWFLE